MHIHVCIYSYIIFIHTYIHTFIYSYIHIYIHKRTYSYTKGADLCYADGRALPVRSALGHEARPAGEIFIYIYKYI
jgi:hypothetical protein